MLAYIEDNPYLFEDDENETNETPDESGSENVITQPESSNQTSVEVPRFPKIPSLTNITEDPLINKDAKVLGALQLVLEENDSSVIFKPHLKKLTSAFYEVRRSIKKYFILKYY